MPFCPLLKCCFATTYSSTHVLAALLPSLYCLMNKVSILSVLLRENVSLENIVLWLYLSDIEQISCIIGGDPKSYFIFWKRIYFICLFICYCNLKYFFNCPLCGLTPYLTETKCSSKFFFLQTTLLHSVTVISMLPLDYGWAHWIMKV